MRMYYNERPTVQCMDHIEIKYPNYADIIYTGKEVIPIDDYKNLEYIVCPCTNTDHLQYWKDEGINIISLTGETEFLTSIHSTAEHTFYLILQLAKNIGKEELKNKSLGILGYGRVGKQVEQYAKAFGMTTHIYDKNIGDLDKTLNCDFVTVHLSVNDTTINFLDGKKLSKINGYLINTSRSTVVNGESLYVALQTHLKGAALDVVEAYSHDLVKRLSKLKNVIITPHIAGSSKESRIATDKFIFEKLKKVIEYDKNNS